MIDLDLISADLKLKQENGKTYVFDPVRKKWVVLTPEEHVRQCMLYYLANTLQYPVSLMAVEKKIMLQAIPRRFDIVIYNSDHMPWMLIECKEPGVPLSEKTLHQLLQYQRIVQCNYWVLTNGHQTFCADACNVHSINWMNKLPVYER